MSLILFKKNPSPKDISQEIDEGIVVRIEPKTKRIVGFTILNFLKRQVKFPIKLPLSAEFEMVK